jgi:hypothetical protein
MSINRKFSVTLIVFVLVPIGIGWLNYYFAEYKNVAWSIDHLNNTSLLGDGISLLGCAYIFYQNIVTRFKNKIWFITTGLISLYLVMDLFIGYSVSHFGF